MTFDLGSDRKISLCGYREKSKNDTVYNGFLLFQCGRKETIEERDETSSCKITQNSDTLLLSEMALLPIGKNFSLVTSPFWVNKIFFRKSAVVDTSFFLTGLPKYSTAQINKVLQQYIKLSGKNYDSVNIVARRLLWACISGSSSAEKCLQQIKIKFGPFDGGIAEEFEDTWATYKLWKNKNNKN